MQVQPLSREDPLEEEMATHSSILAWRIPPTEEPDGLQSMGSQSQTRQGIQHPGPRLASRELSQFHFPTWIRPSRQTRELRWSWTKAARPEPSTRKEGQGSRKTRKESVYLTSKPTGRESGSHLKRFHAIHSLLHALFSPTNVCKRFWKCPVCKPRWERQRGQGRALQRPREGTNTWSLAF